VSAKPKKKKKKEPIKGTILRGKNLNEDTVAGHKTQPSLGGGGKKGL